MATSVHSIASECAPSSRNPPRNVLEPEDVEAIIEEAIARKITVDGDLLKLIEEMKKKGKCGNLCASSEKGTRPSHTW